MIQSVLRVFLFRVKVWQRVAGLVNVLVHVLALWFTLLWSLIFRRSLFLGLVAVFIALVFAPKNANDEQVVFQTVNLFLLSNNRFSSFLD